MYKVTLDLWEGALHIEGPFPEKDIFPKEEPEFMDSSISVIWVSSLEEAERLKEMYNKTT